MAEKKYTLCKEERINGTKRIDKLFSSGDSFIAYPLRIVYLKREKSDDIPNVCMMVSVSKRKFKRAVKRNRVKRLVREAFRLNKQELETISNRFDTGLDVAFIYLKNELPEYKEIEDAVLKTSATLSKKLSNTTTNE